MRVVTGWMCGWLHNMGIAGMSSTKMVVVCRSDVSAELVHDFSSQSSLMVGIATRGSDSQKRWQVPLSR